MVIYQQTLAFSTLTRLILPRPIVLHNLDGIAIGELAPDQSLVLVRQLLDGSPPPALLTLLEKAQGNPLFIESLVQHLRESGDLVREPAGWQLLRTPATLSVPDRIEGLLTARLDRLEEQVRETLKVAAVVGQRFAYPVLAEVLAQVEDLDSQLHRLDHAALIAPEAPPPLWTYLFRHTLIRDVAYDALLYARRRELHQRVAEVLIQLGAGQSDEQLALLARHYLLAERWPEAFSYHLQAGRVAQRRYANREALALFSQALRIGADPGAPFVAPLNQRAEIHERLGWLYSLSGAYEEALAHYQQALNLAPTEPPDDQLRLHHHIAQVAEKRAEFELAFGWIERGLALTSDHNRPAAVRCLLLGAGLHQRQGRYPQALEWGERALAASEHSQTQYLQAEALMLLGGTYSLLGEHSRAHELTSRCLALAEASGDLNRLADAHNNLALIDHDLGRLDEALHHYRVGAELKQQIGDVYGEALIANNLGDLLKLRGDLSGAVEQFARSLASFERLGSTYGAGVVRINLGVAHMLNGDLLAAATDFDRAKTLLNQVGAEEYGSELARHRAELALAQHDLVAAQQFADTALASALRLEARADEGVARRVLARVLAATGDHATAWEQLALALALLYEADSPFEIVLALLDLAQLALELERYHEGQHALDEALPLLRELDARPELARAEDLLARYREATDL